MNLYKEAREIASEAWEESDKDFDEAQDYIYQSCNSHQVATYYAKALELCSNWDTSDGEDWLEDRGDIVQKGDSFGQIACRVAFATLYCAAMDELLNIEQDEAIG